MSTQSLYRLTGSGGQADRLGVYLEQMSASPFIASNPRVGSS